MTAAGRAPPGGGGGQTQMQNPAQAGPAVTTQVPGQAVLHLRGATREEEAQQEGERRGITWAEDVVDNEGMGRKSSKGLFFSCHFSVGAQFGT
jgi:protein phosphatase 1 regulatory subunit 11